MSHNISENNMSEAIPMYINEDAFRSVAKSAEQFAKDCIRVCAKMYNFDDRVAICNLGLQTPQVQKVSKKRSSTKRVSMKPKFPIPYSGAVATQCDALRYNHGLYTQCYNITTYSRFCDCCNKMMEKKNLDVPQYGTVQGRDATDLYEYVDPSGKRPTRFSVVMDKYNRTAKVRITEDMVREEARRLGLPEIDDCHFEQVPIKKGRPSKRIVVQDDDDSDSEYIPDADDADEADDTDDADDAIVRKITPTLYEDCELGDDDDLFSAFEDPNQHEEERCFENEINLAENDDGISILTTEFEINKDDEDSEFDVVVPAKKLSTNKTFKKKFCRESGMVYLHDTTTDSIIDKQMYDKNGTIHKLGVWNNSKKTFTRDDGEKFKLFSKK